MLKILRFIELVPLALIIPQFIWSGKEEWWKGLILPGITFFLSCQIVYFTPLRVLFQEWAQANIPTALYLAVYLLRRIPMWYKTRSQKKNPKDLNDLG